MPTETEGSRALTWTARAAAIAVALFLALFAFDALEGEASLGGKFVALAIHLVPTWLCLGGVLVAWRRSWLGGAIFAALALAYAWWARAHPDWVLGISGPLLLVAALYALAWRRRSSVSPPPSARSATRSRS